MLPKSQRLISSEVEEVMSKGQALFGYYLLVKFIKNKDSGLKVSAISPKKAFPTAVERNKIRRRVYSALFPVLRKEITKNSFLVAIVANKKALNATVPALSSEIEQIFIKGGIL